MKTEHTQTVDITVVGGGMVGAAAAVLLARLGWRVAVVESVRPESIAESEPMDLRVSAISPASIQVLQQAGAWAAIQASGRAKAYQELATWEMSGCETRFAATDIGRSELGFILENRLMQWALWQQLAALPNVTCHCPASVTALTPHSHGVQIQLSDATILDSQWALAADGAHSSLRQLAGIGTTQWDYRQDCMLIHVSLAEEAPAETWQRFYPSGPRSFLPLAQKQASLVWYDSPAKIQELLRLSPAALCSAVRQAFPPLPEFQVQRRAAFPLTRRHTCHYVQNRVIVLGDAAHTIHPLAGQGVNLGFQDVALLCRLAAAAERADTAWTNADLQQYAHQRAVQNQIMQSAMDLFYVAFSNTCTPLKWLRNTGLKLMNHAPLLKRAALYHALGIMPLTK